jgi:hypothetical protein
MRPTFFWLLSLLWGMVFLPGSAEGQTLEYDVLRSDHPIGQMTVSRERRGEREILRSDMEIDVSFGFTITLRFTYEAEFEGGRLRQALVRNYRSGHLRDETSIEPKGDALAVTCEGETFLVEDPVYYTILRAYFQPPDTREQVFSERWGRYQAFTHLDDGRYVMQVANGDQSYYTYQNGVCQQIELHLSLATLYVRKREP